MKLTNLIEALQDLADELGEDKAAETEVQVMYQPGWPLLSNLAGLSTKSATDKETDDAENQRMSGLGIDDDEDNDGPKVGEDNDQPEVIYLMEGSQIGYGNKHAWDCITYC